MSSLRHCRCFANVATTSRTTLQSPAAPLYAHAHAHAQLQAAATLCHAATLPTRYSAFTLASTGAGGAARLFHSSRGATYPRTPLGRSRRAVESTERAVEEEEGEEEAETEDEERFINQVEEPQQYQTTEQVQSAPASSSASSAPEVPWFLEEETISIDDTSSSSLAGGGPTAVSSQMEAPLFNVPSNLPRALRLMQSHLLTCSAANYLYQSDGLDDDLDLHLDGEADLGGGTFKYIYAKPLQDGISWCDWVAIVTVRENNGGQFNDRIAREAAEVLKRVGPPRWDDPSMRSSSSADMTTADAAAEGSEPQPTLDDLLGPSDALSGRSSPYGPVSTTRRSHSSIEKARKRSAEQQASDAAAAESSSSSEERTIPEWQRHREALSKKFGGTAWRPRKILSRETQAGLRMVHSLDPEKWSVTNLAGHFKISPESIRRILKARPERWGGDALERGPRTLLRDQAGLDSQQRDTYASSADVRYSGNSREQEEVEKLQAALRRDRIQAGIEDDVFYMDDVEEELRARERGDQGEASTVREAFNVLDVKEEGVREFDVGGEEVRERENLLSPLPPKPAPPTRTSTKGEIATSPMPTPTPTTTEPLPAYAPLDVTALGPPSHPIRFEGLASSSSSTHTHRISLQRHRRSADETASSKTHAGEWCLVDAGWCVVHVMTPRARAWFDIEGVWNREQKKSAREVAADADVDLGSFDFTRGKPRGGRGGGKGKKSKSTQRTRR